ncbi:MAG: NosD domain-containing protein, partial [Candidatus Margulisiibacteriota bacterium]
WEIIFDITTQEAGYSTGEAYPGLVTSGSDTWFRIIVGWPALTTISNNNIYIRGSSQTREANNALGPKVEIKNSAVLQDGLMLTANNCTVEGLAINGFSAGSSKAIMIDAGDYNAVRGCYIGVSPIGEAKYGTYTNQYGIYLSNGANYNRLGGTTSADRNVISGNANGISLNNSHSNDIWGNYIGLSASGVTGEGSGVGNNYGVLLDSGSSYNTIGGDTAAKRNYISQNAYNGIFLLSGNNYNIIQNNYIGLATSGAYAIPNAEDGISLSSSDYNTIEANVISGHTGPNDYGIALTSSSNFTRIIGNYIGTDASGTVALGNYNAIYLSSSDDNTIGGSTVAERNILCGSSNDAIEINSSNRILIKGNYIGLSSAGTALGNTQSGVSLSNSNNCLIGGIPSERNYISGNGNDGIEMSGVSYNEIRNNYIGLLPDGATPAGNQGDGIAMGSADYNTIESNVISGQSGGQGIYFGSASDHNWILGNYIGTNANGTAAVANNVGLYLPTTANYNIIGTTDPADRNIISGNTTYGIFFSDASSNEVVGNYIGVSATGASLGNDDSGIWLWSNSNYNTIGPANIIAHNGDYGVEVSGLSTYDLITQNTMESNANKGIYIAIGSNQNISYPVISQAIYDGSQYTTLTGTATSGATIEIFKTEATPGGDNQGEGQVYLGTVTAEGSGSWIGTVEGVTDSDKVTATASLFFSPGYTSEFAINKDVFSDSSAPTVTVESPNGGEQWMGGVTYEVTWTATDETGIDEIRLYYTTGSGWTTIATGEANDGTYDWQTPAINSNSVRVSIEAVDSSPQHNVGTDESDANFTIDSNPPSAPNLVTPTDGSTIADNTPTLTWEAATDNLSGIGSYEITLDSTLITQGATTTYTTGTLSEGFHTWEVRARDVAGNWGSANTAITFEVDTAGPTLTTIEVRDTTSLSQIYTDNRVVSVEAIGVSGSPTQMIISESSSFAGASWVSYLNPTTFEVSAGDGTKEVYYKLRDVSSNESASVEASIILDTTGPSAPTLVTPADGSTTGDTTPALTWEASTDTFSRVGSYEITLDSALITQEAVTIYTSEALSDGLHTWEVRARDVAGNWGSASTAFTFEVSTIRPSVTGITLRDITTLDPNYTNDRVVSVEASGVLGSPTQMVISESATFEGSSWASYLNPTTFEVSAGDGTKEVYYKLRNVSSNESASVEASIVLDTTGPSAPTIVTPANGSTTGDTTPTLTWEASTDTFSGVGSYEITLDSTLITQGAVTIYTSEALSYGLHTWKVRARDVAGNWGSASTTFTFEVSTIGPSVAGITLRDITTLDPNYTNDRTVSVEASGVSGGPTQMVLSESATFSGASWISYLNPTTFEVSAGDGTKEVFYKLRDAALVESATVEASIILDTTSPEAPSLVSPPDGSSTNEATPTFSWSATTDATSGVASYEITINSPTIVATFSANTTSYTSRALDDGMHSWKMRTKDRADNWGPFSSSWHVTVMIDSVSPEVSISIADRGIKSGDSIDSQTTEFEITMTDDSSLAASTTNVYFDDTAVSYFIKTLTDNLIELTYAPGVLTDGKHSIKAQVADAAGNVGIKEVVDLTVVTGPVAIKDIIVSPSPFAPSSGQSVKIAYVLSKDADLRILMYSISGELAWNRIFASGAIGGLAGYNEISYNGISDTTGMPAGNGVYVFKVVADNKVIGKGHIVVYE